MPDYLPEHIVKIGNILKAILLIGSAIIIQKKKTYQ